MDQQYKKPAANTAASSAASSGSSSSSRSMHGSVSSAFLGVSSSSTHSQRRSSPSLYPPPAPARLPGHGHLASRGSAASGGGGSASASGSSSSSQLYPISPSPAAAPYRHHARPNLQRTHSLPTPFLLQLSSIRRTGANVFSDLNAQEMMMRSSSSSLTMPHSHHHTPILSGEFSGNFSGFPLPASLPQQMQPSSSTEPPAEASQHFSTYLAHLPNWTTIFQSSSSCSADHAQPSSDSEMPPLPPSLEIGQCGLPPLGHLSQNNGSSTESSSSTGFVQPSSDLKMYELAPLPPSLQIPPPLLQQVKQQEPVLVAPSLASEIISLDDDGDDLSALVHSFASSQHGQVPASLPTTNLEDRHMLDSAVVEGDGQTWEAMPAPASVDMVNNGGGSTSSIPGNCHDSMPLYSQSQQQVLQQLSDLLYVWSSSSVSSSCDQSMGSSVAGTCQGTAGMPALANKFDTMSIVGSRSCSGAGPQMSWNYNSFSVQSSTPMPVGPKLILGGMDKPGLPPRPPALGAGASSSSGGMSRRGAKEHFFSEYDKETISKDNELRELVKTDPKRVKRILRNRVHVARLKVRKENHFKDLQHRADALKMECSSLSAQVQSHQEMMVNLKTKNREMQIKLEGLNEQANLNQVLNQHLQAEVQRLKLLELNMMSANGMHNPKGSHMAGWSASSSANDLHQLMHSHASDIISPQQLQAQEHGTKLQLQEQPNQVVDDELMGQQQLP